MRFSILVLPALLRSAVVQAVSFSVNDDILAFPQYEVRFSDDWIPESLANTRLQQGDSSPGFETGDGNVHVAVDNFKLGGQTHEDDVKDGEDRQYESMTLDGQRYLCSIPTANRTQEHQQGLGVPSKLEEEEELAHATLRGWELLSGMQGQCVYFISGWWSYQFCYNEGVRQFHQLPPNLGVPPFPPVEDPSVEGFTLGKYRIGEPPAQMPKGGPKAGTAASKVAEAVRDVQRPGGGELVQQGDTRYLVQKLEGGTRCDLTGKERKIEVQFHCSPQSVDRISLIKEVSTCAYLMVIQTPRLCSDVAFLPPQKDQPNTLLCSPVLAENEVERYEADLKELRALEKEASIWETDIDAAMIFLGQDVGEVPVIVGDIVVGGHNIVPAGMKIAKSSILTGGKKSDVIASSDGKVLSREELKKLGVEDMEAVEELKRKVEKLAQGQEWKVEVLNTPQGREYRGIVGSDDAEEDRKGSKREADDKSRKKDGNGDDSEKPHEGSEEHYKEDL